MLHKTYFQYFVFDFYWCCHINIDIINENKLTISTSFVRYYLFNLFQRSSNLYGFVCCFIKEIYVIGSSVWNSIKKSYVYFCIHSCYCSCFCEAVEADTHKLLHNFGSIQNCRGWLKCNCRHSAMVTCGDACNTRVTNWLKTHGWTCKFARTKYTASTCGSVSYGGDRKTC